MNILQFEYYVQVNGSDEWSAQRQHCLLWLPLKPQCQINGPQLLFYTLGMCSHFSQINTKTPLHNQPFSPHLCYHTPPTLAHLI